MNLLILGLALFLGVHSVGILAPTWRERMVARLGLMPWRGLYALISLVGFVLMVWGYGQSRLDPVGLYAPPIWTRHLALLLLVPIFPLLLATYLPGRISATVKMGVAELGKAKDRKDNRLRGATAKATAPDKPGPTPAGTSSKWT